MSVKIMIELAILSRCSSRRLGLNDLYRNTTKVQYFYFAAWLTTHIGKRHLYSGAVISEANCGRQPLGPFSHDGYNHDALFGLS
jgi:hypothetical protein